MFYRIRQFIQALFPSLSPTETVWIETLLFDEALTLFYSQSPIEQRHGLDVALDLQNVTADFARLSSEEKITLLTAALLHDCGKSAHPLKLRHRIYIVLAAALPPLQMLSRLSPRFAAPLTVAEDHPRLGEELAVRHHLHSAVCHLINTHHNPNSSLGHLLYEADNRH